LAQEQAGHAQTRENLVQEQTGHVQTRQQNDQIQQTLNRTQTELSEGQRRYQELERALTQLETTVNTQNESLRTLEGLQLQAQSKQEAMREITTRFSTINLKNLNEIQQWVNDCSGVFGFSEEEKRNLENNLSAMTKNNSNNFFLHNLLRDALVFSLGGASVYSYPIIINLIFNLIK
jgi:ATP-dependent exoDNAse (exonuclease V) beta subunit